jgi:hypothetical protein
MRLPLSGDVNQVINPWRWFFNWAGNQFSVFTVNLGRSRAPEVEAEILEEVGSYGRQIGRISDAVEVLMKRLPRSELSEQELAAIEAMSVQIREVNAIKRRRLGADATA